MTVETRPIEVEPRTKTVGDVLRHAARIIEERGWTQELFEGDEGGYCVYGAIGVAEGTNPFLGGLESPAGHQIVRYTQHAFGLTPIVYNDTPGRTAAEVIAALRAAADEADR